MYSHFVTKCRKHRVEKMWCLFSVRDNQVGRYSQAQVEGESNGGKVDRRTLKLAEDTRKRRTEIKLKLILSINCMSVELLGIMQRLTPFQTSPLPINVPM